MSRKNIPVKWILLTTILFLTRCKVPYDPPVINSQAHYLVVEGNINTNGTTNIQLSRTRSISVGDTATRIYELNAKVTIEDNANNIYPLTENGNGSYSGSYYLSPLSQYRLRITTSDQQQYLSAFVACKLSPPIDSVGWNFNSDGGVHLYVNTHDPLNKTKYYRWSFKETWEFHSQYYSFYQYQPLDSTVIQRIEPVFVCYNTDSSSAILLGSSAKLQQDVIYQAPLADIAVHDKRISVLYSIIVTQYVLDSAGYNYWSAMKSNTEDIGSIFGTQPNQTPGNIKCTSDSLQPVVGYVDAGSIQQTRIYISNSSMPATWNLLPDCVNKIVPGDSLVYYYSSGGFTPIQITLGGYFSAESDCVDCTLSGSPIKPSFWP